MADVRAFRSGNWSDTTATSPWWNGTAIFAPAAGDNVYCNTFTITVDVSASVTTITNGSATSRVWKDGGTATATAGGSLSLNNGITLTAATAFQSGTGTLLTLAGTNSATLVGNITAHSTGAGVGVLHSSSGTLNFTGNTSPGGASTVYSIHITGSGSLVMTGNAVGSSASTAEGVRLNSSTGTVTITGNSIGSVGIGTNNVLAGNVTIIGNVTGGSAAAGANNASTGTFTIIGDITATNGANGFISSNSGATNRLSGSFINAANGYSAIYAVKYFLNTSPIAAKTRYSLNGSSTYLDMFTADNSLGQASISDVRFGTVYASGALTGVAYIPTAGSVAAGVPVDNTVGTATLTAANVRAALGMASANLDTQLAAIPTAVTNANAVRTNLSTELGRIDATISSRSTLTAANVRTELAPELTQVTEVHKIHGLDIANALTVTPTLRSAGAITQAITGDGTTSTIVTRV